MMGMSFWKNKRVLVTGHEGFLGAHLTLKLIALGAKVTGLDIRRQPKDGFLKAEDRRRFVGLKGNVANARLVRDILKKYKVQTVFHLAAESLVGSCLKNPHKAFQTNIEGTWTLLDACRFLGGVDEIIVASTDKAYGVQKKLPYQETTPLQGSHPYDVSKSCADLICYAYWNTYGLPVGVTRCGNIFGPGDLNFSRIVPDALRCAITKKTLRVRSNGKFVRDYVYVDDIVDGYLKFAQLMRKRRLFGEAFNLSDEKPLSVIGLLKMIDKVTAGDLKFEVLNSAKHEIPEQFLDSSKARRILGWRPKVGLEKGIQRSLDWYRQYFKQ
jgi:CDP-glucose 4,6-dehydratase